MKRLLAVAALTLMSTVAFAQNEREIGSAGNREAELASFVTDAEQFSMMAATTDLFEIQSSQLALEQSQNAEIRAFAEQMIADHTATSQALAAIITQAALPITLPTGVDTTQAQKMEDLYTRRGEDFDASYVRWQRQTHEAAVALFTSYAEAGDQEQLKAFAAQNLPALQMHLEMVLAMEATLVAPEGAQNHGAQGNAAGDVNANTPATATTQDNAAGQGGGNAGSQGGAAAPQAGAGAAPQGGAQAAPQGGAAAPATPAQ